MGVTGLWRLIEPAGKPVPVETLENKVLAVDISIWLHQMVKGYQDAKGAPLPNAHLMGLFQRLCKLLYFRIKPVFVFDGAFPELKKETIARRQDSKAKYQSESERLKRELALLLSKKTAVSSLLGKQISPKKGNAPDANNDDIFKLPALPDQEVESDSDLEEDSSGSIADLHSVDIESDNFKKLPVKDKYNLLIDLKETRKMNSWGKLHELPKKSDNFSDFQMQRLLKRRKVQECLQETEKEMGDISMSLNELESLLNEEGIDTKIESLPTRRIASDNTTRILMINNVKKALEDARKRKEAQENTEPQTDQTSTEIGTQIQRNDELEEDMEKAIQMSLECANEADTSACTSKTGNSWTTFMTDSDYTDSEDEDGFEQPDMSSAKAYIKQYCDFSNKAVEDIVVLKKGGKSKSKVPKASQIIEELNKEKSVIVDRVDLSSSDDDDTSTINKVMDTNKTSSDEFNSSCKIINSSNLDETEASILCIENPAQDVITLDSSTEGDIQQDNAIPGPSITQGKETFDSESENDEFVEVPELDSEFKKPVVQIILDPRSQDPVDDDIFADIFTAAKPIDEDDVDEELQKAIQMSLECVVSTSNTSVVSTSNTTIVSTPIITKFETPKEPIGTQQISNTTIVSTPKIATVKPPKEPIGIERTSNTSVASTPYIIIAEPPIESISTKQTNNASIASTSKNATVEPSEEPMDTEHKDNTTIVSTSNIATTKPPQEPISTEQLQTMAEEILHEEQDLIHEKGRLDRIGRNITEQMTKEAQELLQIFGIPYIVAPMEAEAQCAFLESVNLTDGTITDDSDIWLFGGRTVYKNFFNQKKHVLQFLAERIERSFNLTREQLVLLALLVGSDYTTGVTGVGPVTALEILASFPFSKKQFVNETSKQARYAKIVAGLQEFKKWVKAGKRTDNITLKKKLKNVDLTDDFPSVRVVQAYLEPNVEKSEDKFTWGEIDITILRDYTKAKFGWSQHKLDEIIMPVIKRIVDRKSQRSVQDYFKRKVEFQSLEEQMSKRVKAAIQRMGPEAAVDESEAVPTEQTQKPARKRKVNKKATVSELQKEDGQSQAKRQNNVEADVFRNQGVTVVSQVQDGKSNIEIKIHKTDRFQEIIPQREKDKQHVLQNKLKAIELFRKTKIDKKKKATKRVGNLPKEKAELSESSDTD